jgi:hypothetical protein
LIPDEFDDEEIVINQYPYQTKGALAEWIVCAGVKSRRSWFDSTGRHIVSRSDRREKQKTPQQDSRAKYK